MFFLKLLNFLAELATLEVEELGHTNLKREGAKGRGRKGGREGKRKLNTNLTSLA
jgi:hypothetical protein